MGQTVIHVRGSDKYHTDPECQMLKSRERSTRDVDIDRADCFWEECQHCNGEAEAALVRSVNEAKSVNIQ